MANKLNFLFYPSRSWINQKTLYLWTFPGLVHNIWDHLLDYMYYRDEQVPFTLLSNTFAKFTSWVLHWLCSHGLESRSERRFRSRSKTWYELRAFTCIVNAFPITIRICALRGNILLLRCSPRALIDPCAYAWLQRACFKCFAFTCPRIRLSRRITIQTALFSRSNAFQKPDLKQLWVHMG